MGSVVGVGTGTDAEAEGWKSKTTARVEFCSLNAFPVYGGRYKCAQCR